MILTLQRTKGKAPGYPTLGRLSGSGIDIRTLEDTYILDTLMQPAHQLYKWPFAGVKIPGVTAIPAGRYRAYLTMSPKFGRVLPILVNVPQYEGIRCHQGASAEHTEGCIITGLEIAGNLREVVGGKAAENQLVEWFRAYEKEEIWFDIRNPIDV